MSESSHIIKQNYQITKAERIRLLGQKPCILWFTGLSGSGKSTLSNLVEMALHQSGKATYLLDGDNIRHGLNSNVDFSEAGRQENIRRIGEVAKLFLDAGVIVLTAFISPFRADRDRVRALVLPSEFIEIFVDCPLEVCMERDVKGLYKKAQAGEIPNFTGISSPFEIPKQPELIVRTHIESPETCVNRILDVVMERIKPQPL